MKKISKHKRKFRFDFHPFEQKRRAIFGYFAIKICQCRAIAARKSGLTAVAVKLLFYNTFQIAVYFP